MCMNFNTYDMEDREGIRNLLDDFEEYHETEEPETAEKNSAKHGGEHAAYNQQARFKNS